MAGMCRARSESGVGRPNLVALGGCAAADLLASDRWVFRRVAAAIVCAAIAGVGGRAPAASVDAPPVELKEATREAFQQYVRHAEARVDRRLAGRDAFLWTDESPARLASLRRGEVVTGPSADRAVTEVPDGLVFDLTGAVFIAGATLDAVLGVMQDYPKHKVYYAPEVLDSATRSRDGDDYVVYLRLRKKKVLTVVLDTEHQARYVRLDDRRVYSRSVSTRIVEVENAGQRDERTLPAGAGHGFLWALNSYWRLHERDGGVLVECQAISLSRDIPWGLGWLIEPIVNDLPVESLERTLAATRAAVAALRPR